MWVHAEKNSPCDTEALGQSACGESEKSKAKNFEVGLSSPKTEKERRRALIGQRRAVCRFVWDSGYAIRKLGPLWVIRSKISRGI
jgi:hypothetical protein